MTSYGDGQVTAYLVDTEQVTKKVTASRVCAWVCSWACMSVYVYAPAVYLPLLVCVHSLRESLFAFSDLIFVY